MYQRALHRPAGCCIGVTRGAPTLHENFRLGPGWSAADLPFIHRFLGSADCLRSLKRQYCRWAAIVALVAERGRQRSVSIEGCGSSTYLCEHVAQRVLRSPRISNRRSTIVRRRIFRLLTSFAAVAVITFVA